MKAIIFRHLMYSFVLMLFLPLFRQYQAVSLVAFTIYFCYIGFHFIGKEYLLRKYLFVPVIIWSGIAVLTHDYSLLVLVAVFPSLMVNNEDSSTNFIRWVIWATIPIAVLTAPSTGYTLADKLHYHALTMVSLLLSIITLPMPEHHIYEANPTDSSNATESKSDSEGSSLKKDEPHDSYKQVLSMGLVNGLLHLEYKEFNRDSVILTTLKTLCESENIMYAAYYKADKDCYVLEQSYGSSPLKLQKSYPFGVGMVGQVYTSGSHIYANDLLAKEPDKVKRDLLKGMDALLSMPVVSNNNIVGVLYIGFTRIEKDEQTAYVELCGIASEKMGHEFEKLSVHTHVEWKSQTDKLTGLYNREFFDTTIEKEFKEAQENNTNLAYVLLDLDYFKQMNDTWGHDFGDKVLIEAAKTFQRNIRETDYVCRTGGDEFSLIIKGANKNTVYDIVKRIRDDYANVVERNKFYANKDGEKVKSSLSIGVAVYPHPKAVSAAALIKLADLAVYHVKENGKNSFCFVK